MNAAPIQAFEAFSLPITASEKEVNDAYRAKVLKHNPDKGGDANTFMERRQAKKAIDNWRKAPANESIEVIRRATHTVFGRRPDIPASCATKSLFYHWLVDLIHKEEDWIAKRDIRRFLWTDPYSGQCEAVWALEERLRSKQRQPMAPPMQEPAPPPPPPMDPLMQEPAPPPPPPMGPLMQEQAAPPPSSLQEPVMPAPQLLYVNDYLPKYKVGCDGCGQWSNHCLCSHTKCQ